MSRVLRSSPRVLLALLLTAYIFNFLDRQILGILAQPIKADLNLSDSEFGIIGGTAFAILYSVLGLPLAYLADRTSRSAVVAASVAVWSVFTVLCGMAISFAQLFFYRLGVGVGEAGGVAPSYALIADHFPPERRARALAIYSLGVPIGLAGGSLIGAYLAFWLGWRWAFLIMGIAGVMLSPILLLFARDLPRSSKAGDQAPIAEVFPLIARKPSFWLLALASSSSSLIGYALALWTPSVMMRSFNLDVVTTGQFLASLLLIGGTAGVFAGGWFADRLGAGDKAWYARLPAIAWLVSAVAWSAGLMAPNLYAAWLLLLIGNGVNILWLGPVATSVQHLAPARMRSSASGSFLLINNLIGLGAGPLLIGAVSDALKGAYGADSLRIAAIAGMIFYFLAAALMFAASRRLSNDWVDDAQ